MKRFIEGSDLQVMVMTTHSFSADDNIINRPDRDDKEVELHLVVETKSTDKIDQLTPEEQVKIRCAIRHFQALGIRTNTTLRYKAPVTRFNPKVDEASVDYGDAPDPMGFFAPKNSFGLTLQEATASAEQENS